MSKTNKSLSDLLDDQCSSSNLDNLLNDKDVSDSWHRYNTVSAIIKGEYSAHASINFCKNISEKIADEPTILAAPRPQQTKNRPSVANIRKIGSGFAIAASAAFATFFSVQTLQVSSELSPLNESSAEVNQIKTENLAVKDSMPINSDSVEQSNLELLNDMYIARLSEQDSTNSVSGDYVKTIRISAEQWQQILKAAAFRQSQLEAAEKAKLETESSDKNDVDNGENE